MARGTTLAYAAIVRMIEKAGPGEGNVLWLVASLRSFLARTPGEIARTAGKGVLAVWSLASRRPVAAALFTTAALTLALSYRLLYAIYLDRSNLPDLEPFLRFEPAATGKIYDERGNVLIELANEYREIVTYDEIPSIVRDALLSAEDRRFFAHSGVDYLAFPRVAAKAAWRSITRGHVSFPQGGSTLTQQLVRGYFLEDQLREENGRRLLWTGFFPRLAARLLGPRAANKLVRKVEEMRLSLWLEDELSLYYGSKEAAKKEILSRYASFVYMGNGRYGFAAASAFYFGRPLSSLKRSDAPIGALLAGITKSPADYAPAPSDVRKAVRRRNQILAQMAEDGRIPKENLPRFLSSRVRLVSVPCKKTSAPTAVGTVLYEMARLEKESSLPVGISTLFNGRVGIRTTLDDRLQKIVNAALENGLRRYEKRHPASAGVIQGSAIVLRNRDAAILAEAGGREVYKGRETSYADYDRVRDSKRQPGSAIKPLVYLAALRKGVLTPDSLVADEPISVSMGTSAPPKWIANYDGKFKGMVPARLALAESRNAAAIWVAQRIGIRSVIETARELGIETPLAPYPSTALGGSEVTLLELANVYRAIASGTLARPHAIEEVTDGAGVTLYQWSEPVRELPGGAPMDDIRELLRGVVRIPTGTAHALDQNRAFPIPVMGKTGTTNDFRDALFVGSTYGPSGITAAIRIGFDDDRELGEKETGGRAALPIFKEIMLQAYGTGILGPPPALPRAMEDSIEAYLEAPEEMDPAPEDARPLLLGTTIAAVQ